MKESVVNRRFYSLCFIKETNSCQVDSTDEDNIAEIRRCTRSTAVTLHGYKFMAESRGR